MKKKSPPEAEAFSFKLLNLTELTQSRFHQDAKVTQADAINRFLIAILCVSFAIHCVPKNYYSLISVEKSFTCTDICYGAIEEDTSLMDAL
jgi:hypothetical protein